jgi:carbon monoxide dehydrogenase subunit G
MAIEARGETLIARGAGDVFDFVSDPRNEPGWLPGAKHVEMTSDEPVRLGSTFVGRYARVGRVQLELVEFERPHSVTFRGTSATVDFDDVVELHEHDGKTHLDAKLFAEARGPMRLAELIMARSMRKKFAAGWDHLRSALED